MAVHGLNPVNKADHAFNTWRKPQNDKGHLWLRDALPKVQANARVFLYEYNSSPVFGAGKDSFVREANALLDEIYGERWGKVSEASSIRINGEPDIPRDAKRQSSSSVIV